MYLTSGTPRTTRSYQIDDVERIYQRLDRVAEPKLLSDTSYDIQHYLSRFGITFEGQPLPVSLTPTVVPRTEIDPVARAAQIIRGVLNRMIVSFVDEHRKKRFDGPLHRFFTPYYAWWDIIAQENRRLEHI